MELQYFGEISYSFKIKLLSLWLYIKSSRNKVLDHCVQTNLILRISIFNVWLHGTSFLRFARCY